MSKLKRYYNTHSIYFVTCVTLNRKPILLENLDLLWKSINTTIEKHKCELITWAVLPDHFHMMLNTQNTNLSKVITSIKLSFWMKYKYRQNSKCGKIWQNQFWDHAIRNQDDFNGHLNYIHYNPVKHGISHSPFEYNYSSINDWRDYYKPDWGVKEKLNFNGGYGK